MAISVGNTHLQTSKKASIDFNKINLIEAKTKILAEASAEIAQKLYAEQAALKESLICAQFQITEGLAPDQLPVGPSKREVQGHPWPNRATQPYA